MFHLKLQENMSGLERHIVKMVSTVQSNRGVYHRRRDSQDSKAKRKKTIPT